MKSILLVGLVSTLMFAQTPNVPQTYPDGELGRMVKLGEAIMNETNTHPLTKDLVGNNLQCKSCHLPGKDGKTWNYDYSRYI